MKKLLIIALLFVGCDRYEYIADDKKIDKWFGNTYIKTVKEPDDSTAPPYVSIKILEWEMDRIRRGIYNHRTKSQIYRDLKKLQYSRDKQFVWKKAETITYHWVKQDN